MHVALPESSLLPWQGHKSYDPDNSQSIESNRLCKKSVAENTSGIYSFSLPILVASVSCAAVAAHTLFCGTEITAMENVVALINHEKSDINNNQVRSLAIYDNNIRSTIYINDYSSGIFNAFPPVERNPPEVLKLWQRLSRLSVGWDGLEGAPPKQSVINDMKELLDFIPLDFNTPDAEIDPDFGTVTLSWMNVERDIFNIYLSGKEVVISTLFDNNQEGCDAWELPLSNGSEIIKRLSTEKVRNICK